MIPAKEKKKKTKNK